MSPSSDMIIQDLNQKIQKLTLKISCLETSLKFESRKVKQLERALEKGFVAPSEDNNSDNDIDQVVTQLEDKVRDQTEKLEKMNRDYKSLKESRLKELSMEEQIKICVNVFKHIIEERTNRKVMGSSDDPIEMTDSDDIKWFDREEYYEIGVVGNRLFRELVFRDEQFLKEWKNDQVRRERTKNMDRELISRRGIRKERVDHMDQMHKKMAQYNPEYSLSLNSGNQFLQIEAPTSHVSSTEEEPIIEQVVEEKENRSDVVRSGIYCYICKRRYFELDHFYDKLCKHCSTLNYEKRLEQCDLTGRVAIVTGGRIRIGYQTALRLLRGQCSKVIVITRFPQNALKRFSTEADFESYKDRLLVYGLDLRDLTAVEEFCKFMYDNFDHLDILVNNAAQTIRRPPMYYTSLIQEELAPVDQLPNHMRACLTSGKQYSSTEMINKLQKNLESITNSSEDISARSLQPSPQQTIQVLNTTAHRAITHLETVLQTKKSIPAALLSAIPRIPEDLESNPADFPLGERDDQLDQLDRRANNTWKNSIESVSSVEALEVQMCNVMAPFILVKQLQGLFTKSPYKEKFIVNVSSVEGLFSKNFKQKFGHHPHTNMSKSSLNMLTMTMAPKYAIDYQIYMTCVDPGWVSQLCPYPQATTNKTVRDFSPPLDEVDAAARITQPVYEAIKNNKYLYGVFLKDYEESEW